MKRFRQETYRVLWHPWPFSVIMIINLNDICCGPGHMPLCYSYSGKNHPCKLPPFNIAMK